MRATEPYRARRTESGLSDAEGRRRSLQILGCHAFGLLDALTIKTLMPETDRAFRLTGKV